MEHRVSSLSNGQRLLAAIMVTDAVGFSSRMSVDEGLTLRLIDRDLTLLAQICQEFGGTVLKSTGDGLLMYFLSAVEAVSCGLEMQRRLVEQTLGLGPEDYLDHRIGIHLGDIVVSEQDVMGNGVNITARLQTYAQPRGLCVSQTIYDVVKARLSLNAVFLGPLPLKNIKEPVPAYQLSLQPEPDSEPSMGDSTCTVPMSADALLGTALRNLSAHAHRSRIKKLIFATYQQTWENDPAVLDQFELRSLLTSLRDRYPTLGDLEQQLHRVVLGLNRQDVYTEVSALILRELQPWYVRTLTPTPDALQNETTALTVRSLEERCQTIAQRLRQHPDFARLRKLLYCLGYSTWENDAAVLEQVNLADLIQQVLQIAPQRQDLRYHLGRIIKRLNRRREYTRLANTLIDALKSLYLNQSDYTQISAPASGDPQDSAPDHTVVTPFVPADQHPAAHEMTTLQSAGHLAPNTIPETLYGHGSWICRDRSSLFDLRVEIMQYTNPLRAKVLLHSCLHGPFSYTDQDWIALSRATLEDLLRAIFDYCPSYTDLDSKLTIMAHCLGQPDDSLAVASMLTRALRAYYPQNPDETLEPSPERDRPTSAPSQRPSPAVSSALSSA